MANQAEFDFSSADAYAEKALPASSAFKILVALVVSAPATSGPDLIEVGDRSAPAWDEIYCYVDGVPGFGANTNPSPFGTFAEDADTILELRPTNVGGTLWDIAYYQDGAGPLWTDTSQDMGVTIADPMRLCVGARNASVHAAGYAIDIRSVIVKNAADVTIFSEDFSSGDFSLWDTVVGDASIVPVPTPPTNTRFFEGFPWRYIVTDLNTETITFLDRLATNRQVNVGRNQPRDMSGAVPSDNPEINILHTDGDPFLNEGNRLLYAFRREGAFGPGPTWVCRGAGPILFTDDAAQTDQPLTRFTAYDPWKLTYKRPLRLAGGDLPGAAGRVFLAADNWTYQQIAKRLLTDSILYDGTLFIDPDGGTIVDGDPIVEDLTLQQGQSVGQCWDTLCATGNLDIVLAPIYDPVGAPGICVTFNAKPRIGVVRNAAIFAWDLPSRSLVDISKAKDGSGRANKIQYYYGQGGPPVSVQTDAASLAKYGEYWEQQFWPGFKEAGPVTAFAARRLQLVRDGAKTYTFSPAPERSPIPLLEYDPGDWCPFYASKKLRAPLNPTLVSGVWQDIPRVEAFTLDIADDHTETVSQLLTSLEVQPI